MKRKNKFISGLEFFNFKLYQNLELVEKLEKKIGLILPNDLRQFLVHFSPFEWRDEKLYVDTPNFGNEKIIFEGIVNPTFNIFLPFFKIDQIIEKLNDQERFEDFFCKNKVIPICESIPNYEVVYCLEGKYNGKLFYNMDDFEFELENHRIFANCLWDFILNLKIVDRN